MLQRALELAAADPSQKARVEGALAQLGQAEGSS